MPTKTIREKKRQGKRERTSGSERILKGSAPGDITGNLNARAMKNTQKTATPEGQNPENILRQLTQKIKEIRLLPTECTVFLIGEILNLEEQVKILKNKLLEL